MTTADTRRVDARTRGVAATLIGVTLFVGAVLTRSWVLAAAALAVSGYVAWEWNDIVGALLAWFALATMAVLLGV